MEHDHRLERSEGGRMDNPEDLKLPQGGTAGRMECPNCKCIGCMAERKKAKRETAMIAQMIRTSLDITKE